MGGGLSYSDAGLRNRSIFYRQDINIYVEDTGKEYIYEEIFKRLLKNDYRIETILPLGGKTNVLKEYIIKGEFDNRGTPNIFLVDGDFDRYISYDVVGKGDFPEETEANLEEFVSNKIINSDSVIYLETYNIESYYVDENASKKFIKGMLRKTDMELSVILNFECWKNRIVSESKDLFLLYCFLIKYRNLYGSKYNGTTSRLSISTVDRPPFLFLDSKTGFKNDSNEYDELKREVLGGLSVENPGLDLDEELEKIKNDYENINGNDYYNLICGKFLLTSLHKYLKNICGKDIKFPQLEWNLICDFDINKLNFLKERIDRIMINHSASE